MNTLDRRAQTIVDAISLSRASSGFAFLALANSNLETSTKIVVGAILSIAAIASDKLDGILAHRVGLKDRFGRFKDWTADAACATGFITLVLAHQLSAINAKPESRFALTVAFPLTVITAYFWGLLNVTRKSK